tara:strand:- start:578 stop:964 length:387 start_codon:yes stop_codon:yes gene_type:complete
MFLLVHSPTERIMDAMNVHPQVPTDPDFVEVETPGDADVYAWPKGAATRCLWQGGAIVENPALPASDPADEAATRALNTKDNKTLRDAFWQLIDEGGLTILDANNGNQQVNTKGKCSTWLKGIRKSSE